MLLGLYFLLSSGLPPVGELTCYPDTIARPATVSGHQAFGDPKFQTNPFTPNAGILATFPDRLARPVYETQLQRAFVSAPRVSPRFVQEKDNVDGTPLAFTNPNAAGNTLIAGVCWDTFTTCHLTSITDTQGNVWTRAVDTYIDSASVTVGQEIWHCIGCKGGPNTVTIHITGGTPSLINLTITEYNGIDRYVDGHTSFTPTSVLATCGPFAVTHADSLVVAWVIPFGACTAAGAGFTNRGVSAFGGGWEDSYPVAIGNITATETISSSASLVSTGTYYYLGADTSLPYYDNTEYPTAINRASMLAAEHTAFSFYPVPITVVTIPTWFAGEFPEFVDRRWFPVQLQMASTEISPKPERASVLVVEQHPDSVLRPYTLAAQQQAVTELSPLPERGSVFFGTVEPDFILRPLFPTSSQLAVTEIGPFPIPSAPVIPTNPLVYYPDGVVRPMFSASQQLSVTELGPLPLTASVFYGTVQPDFVLRPVFPASEQLASTELSPVPIPAPPVNALVYYPDGVVRPVFGVTQQLATTELSPKPERNAPMWPEQHVDRADRPAYPATQQLAVTEIYPFPNTASVFYGTVQPDYVLRPLMLASEQLAVTEIWPFPIISIPTFFEAVYPDFVVRPVFAAAQQLASTELSPKPERTSVFVGTTDYPEFVLRPMLPVSEQVAFVGSSFVIVALITQPLVWYPDGVVRPLMHATEQMAVTELSPKPERSSVFVDEARLDSILRPFMHATEQLAVTEISPKPERKSVFVDEARLDAVYRPTFGVTQQMAWAQGAPPALLIVILPDVTFSDTVLRPFLAASEHLAFSAAVIWQQAPHTGIQPPPYGYVLSQLFQPAAFSVALFSPTQPIALVQVVLVVSVQPMAVGATVVLPYQPAVSHAECAPALVQPSPTPIT